MPLPPIVRTERYREYLKSDQWLHRRDLVLERDQYKCQACLCNKATQVHHLTYNHVYEEFMYELTSVCESCHRRIHGL